MNRNTFNPEESLHQFISATCVFDDEKVFPARLLYNNYEEFCNRNHIHYTVNENQFVDLLKTHYALDSRRVMLDGEQHRCFVGIALAPQHC